MGGDIICPDLIQIMSIARTIHDKKILTFL